MQKTAEWLSDQLKKSGCDSSKIYSTNGHPIVYGEKLIDKSYPTILVYGHYDVQPPDPIDLWTNPPFEPLIKKTDIHPNGAIFARGACDDKGQVFMHLKAFEQLIKNNKLNCNVKFMIEGEEEVGSENLDVRNLLVHRESLIYIPHQLYHVFSINHQSLDHFQLM